MRSGEREFTGGVLGRQLTIGAGAAPAAIPLFALFLHLVGAHGLVMFGQGAGEPVRAPPSVLATK